MTDSPNSNCTKCRDFFKEEGECPNDTRQCMCKYCPRNLAQCLIGRWCRETESPLEY